MLDIETLGVSPGCVVLHISAVEFNIDTGKTGKEFDHGISVEDSVKNGLVIEASTMKWWMTQNEAAKKAAFESSNSLRFVLTEFNDFLLQLGPVSVWGNGVRFDVGILEGLYKAVGMKMPITGRQERDVRTLVSFRPHIKQNMPFVGEQHVAIDDCKHQIKYCSAIWNNINAVNVVDDRFLTK
jgi:hypothetical protein